MRISWEPRISTHSLNTDSDQNWNDIWELHYVEISVIVYDWLWLITIYYTYNVCNMAWKLFLFWKLTLQKYYFITHVYNLTVFTSMFLIVITYISKKRDRLLNFKCRDNQLCHYKFYQNNWLVYFPHECIVWMPLDCWRISKTKIFKQWSRPEIFCLAYGYIRKEFCFFMSF